jgi:hypothetical protein
LRIKFSPPTIFFAAATATRRCSGLSPCSRQTPTTTQKEKEKEKRNKRDVIIAPKKKTLPSFALSLSLISLSFAKWGTPKAKKEERITEEEDKGNHRNSTSLRETLWRIRWNL